MKPRKAKIPTRFRMSFVHRFPHYSPRLVFSFGLIQLICGTVNVFLTLVLYRYDRDHGLQPVTWIDIKSFVSIYMQETARHTYFNLWIVLSGFITLLVSCRPYSRCQIHLFFVTSLVSVIVSGSYAILLSNTVIQQSIISTLIATKIIDPYRAVVHPEPVVVVNDLSADIFLDSPNAHHGQHIRLGPHLKEPDELVTTNRANLVLILHVFMLSFCVVTFVISIVSFSLVSHHLCTCSMFRSKLSPDYHIYDTSTWSRKERIMQWVLQQQSQLTDLSDKSANRFSIVLDTDPVLVPTSHPAYSVQNLQPSHKNLSVLHSSVTNSSRMSMQEK